MRLDHSETSDNNRQALLSLWPHFHHARTIRFFQENYCNDQLLSLDVLNSEYFARTERTRGFNNTHLAVLSCGFVAPTQTTASHHHHPSSLPPETSPPPSWNVLLNTIHPPLSLPASFLLAPPNGPRLRNNDPLRRQRLADHRPLPRHDHALYRSPVLVPARKRPHAPTLRRLFRRAPHGHQGHLRVLLPLLPRLRHSGPARFRRRELQELHARRRGGFGGGREVSDFQFGCGCQECRVCVFWEGNQFCCAEYDDDGGGSGVVDDGCGA